MSDFGRVLAVSQVDLGSTLAVDHVAGATVVSVEDVADFDDIHGGQVSIDGTVYVYGGVDDEVDTITLATGLVADAGAGTGVVLVDPLSGAVQTEWLAQVTVEGSEPGDPLEASIRDALVDGLGPGLRGIAGEPALLEWDSDDELWLIDVLGKPADGRQGTVKFRNTDTFAAAAGADLVRDLTYQPTDGSENVYWRGVAQVPGVDWTRSGKTLTLLDPGFEDDDPVWVEYAYDITDQPQPEPAITGMVYSFFERTSEAGASQVGLRWTGDFQAGYWRLYAAVDTGSGAVADNDGGGMNVPATGPFTLFESYLATGWPPSSAIKGMGAIWMPTATSLDFTDWNVTPQADPQGLVGVHDPDNLRFYYGEKVADIPDSTIDEPGGPVGGGA